MELPYGSRISPMFWFRKIRNRKIKLKGDMMPLLLIFKNILNEW